MTARYRRQVLMSLVHQLSYRPLGEVSNIGVTEAGWRRFSDDAITPSFPRHIDATIAIKKRVLQHLNIYHHHHYTWLSSSSSSSLPPCLRQASSKSSPSFSVLLPSASHPLERRRPTLSRSIFILRRSTSRHAALAHPFQTSRGFARVPGSYYRIFYPMLLAYFTRFVEYPRSESIRRNEGNVDVKVAPTRKEWFFKTRCTWHSALKRDEKCDVKYLRYSYHEQRRM